MQILLDTETAQEGCRLALSVPPIEVGKLLLQLSYLDTIFVGKVFLSVDSVLLLHDLPELVMPHQDGVDDGILIESEVVLAEHRESLIGSKGDGAACRL